MKIYSREGQTMVDVNSLRIEGEDLVMNGKLMDAYSMPLYVKPSEIVAIMKLISFDVLCALPGMLLKGVREAKKEKRNREAQS